MMRSRLTMFLAAVLAVGATVAAPVIAGSASAATPTCNDPGARVPIILVHGLNGDSSDFTAHANGAEDLITRLGAIPNVFVDLFSYSTVADRWVTNPGIGQSLADRIGCLAAKSKAAGGLGKVIIVAHSMGGLAAREAMSLKYSVNQAPVAPMVGLLVTVATPNTGSWSDALFHEVRGNPLSGPYALDIWLLQGACGAIGVYTGPKRPGLCGVVQDSTSQAGTAMIPGSSELATLSAPPTKLAVDAVAGQVAVTTKLFLLPTTFTLIPAGMLGDLLVKPDSALAYGSGGGRQAFTQSCSMPVSEVWAGQGWNGCTHGGLLYDSGVGQQVKSWIEAWIEKSDLSSPVRLSLVPVTTCATQVNGGSPSPQPSSSLDRSPLTGLGPVSMYTDSEGNVQVLAPSGWNCQAVVGTDGNTPVDVWPNGSSPPVGNGISEGIEGYVIPACVGCIFDLVCPLFSASSTSSINPGGMNTCNTAPPASETDTPLNGSVVSFHDPPGVKGTWDNTGSPYPADGVVYFDPNVNGNSNSTAGMAVCVLPPSEHATCTAALDDFAAHYGSTPNSSASTPSAPIVTSPPSPQVPASSGGSPPCDPAALANAAAAHDLANGYGHVGQKQLVRVYCDGDYAAGLWLDNVVGSGSQIVWQYIQGAWQTVFTGSDNPDGQDNIPPSIQDPLMQTLNNGTADLGRPVTY